MKFLSPCSYVTAKAIDFDFDDQSRLGMLHSRKGSSPADEADGRAPNGKGRGRQNVPQDSKSNPLKYSPPYVSDVLDLLLSPMFAYVNLHELF